MSLTPDDRRAALDDLPDWRYNMAALRAAFEAETDTDALRLVAAIGIAAGEATGHLDLDWRQRHVFVRLRDNEACDVTALDVEIARKISAVAAGAATARPELTRVIELAIDAAEPQRLASTWAAALGYGVDPHGNLFDPLRRGPNLWFQQTETPATSRFHLDVSVADERADEIVDEVVAAGGRRIDDRFRPSFTVIADADGNRLCVCTQLGRD